jgi:hypothetical protein
LRPVYVLINGRLNFSWLVHLTKQRRSTVEGGRVTCKTMKCLRLGKLNANHLAIIFRILEHVKIRKLKKYLCLLLGLEWKKNGPSHFYGRNYFHTDVMCS